MKKVWVSIDKWDKSIVVAAIEGGADAIVVPTGYNNLISKLAKITVVAEDGDLIPNKDVFFYNFKSSDDEYEIIKLAKNKVVIIKCVNWKIIPLENLIAKGGKIDNIIVEVKNLKEGELVLNILEKGVGGIIINAKNSNSLRIFLSSFNLGRSKIILSSVLIESIECIGIGDRVCVDTCSSMVHGEGILVGNSSSYLFLIHAENIVNPYVNTRSFRVNAGAVHSYVRTSDIRMKYLTELTSGNSIQIVNYKGYTRKAVVGRIKIERRPLLLIRAKYDDSIITTIVQNAETINLVSPDKKTMSVVSLKPGDKVLVMAEKIGCHFGYKIDENIVEK